MTGLPLQSSCCLGAIWHLSNWEVVNTPQNTPPVLYYLAFYLEKDGVSGTFLFSRHSGWLLSVSG